MDGKITSLPTIPAMDRAIDLLEIVDVSTGVSSKTTPNQILGITGAPIGSTDTQTLTNKTLTAPTLTSAIFNGTITGTYTLAGTPTFPATVVTTTGTQTLTNKTLTSATLTAPTLTNASITADAITGFTTANSGTIYGVPVTAGKISGASISNSSVGPSQLNTTAQAVFVATSEATSSATYTNLATVTDTVTVIIGVNGLALVTLYANFAVFTANNNPYVSFVVSGANTLAANDNMALNYQAYTSNSVTSVGASFLLTGLATGSTTFKMQYRSPTGTAVSFANRRIGVVPL